MVEFELNPKKATPGKAGAMTQAPAIHALESSGMKGREWPRIIIIASIGFAVRNYLLGHCFAKLRKQSQVTVLSPLAEQNSFRATMNERGADVLPLHVPVLDPCWQRLRRWRHAFHISQLDNETWRLKQTAEKHERSLVGGFLNSTSLRVARSLTGPRTLRWVDNAEEQRALRSAAAEAYRQIFRDQRPALVFSPAPMMPEEWLPIQVARSMGIPTVLAVLSWDNLSSKARLPLPCSAILVWSDAMRVELLNYYPEISPERVHIVGAPQFDFYQQQEFIESRDAFLRGFGADPSRPVIVYGGVTPNLMPDEPKIIDGLIRAIRSGAVRHNPQLLVRLHPKDDGRRYCDFQANYPEVIFTTPGERHQGMVRAWEPDDNDVRLLVNTVRHGDVHINVASTMTLDAAVMDRPVINIVYDLRPTGALRSWGLCQYECTHYLPILKTGGVRMAHTPSELVQHVNTYLERPTLDREGRRRMVALKCGNVDGRAGERTAKRLLEIAN